MSAGIIKSVEEAINELVKDFVQNQWLHRVEHSLHAELYHLLKSLPGIPTELCTSAFTTQFIHKEWPEPKRHGTRGRRGNFDLAVLKPDSPSSTIDDLRYGRMPLLVAIEVGLNYEAKHLAGDTVKLKESGVEHCYLIHLAALKSRNQLGVRELVQSVMEEERNGGRIKIAFADHEGNFKRMLGDTSISTIR